MSAYLQILDQINAHMQKCGRAIHDVTVIAVSKTHPAETIQQVYQEGCRHFGENRVQEAIQKKGILPQDCQWHLIGSLQKNKINQAITHFPLIHSVDSFELAEQISIACQRKNQKQSILLQLNLSGEMSKHGMTIKQFEESIALFNELTGVTIHGLMTIAPLTTNQKQIHSIFSQLRQLRDQWQPYMQNPAIFKHLSMGMSNDYLIAIEEGATLLRIGSALFGPR